MWDLFKNVEDALTCPTQKAVTHIFDHPEVAYLNEYTSKLEKENIELKLEIEKVELKGLRNFEKMALEFQREIKQLKEINIDLIERYGLKTN